VNPAISLQLSRQVLGNLDVDHVTGGLLVVKSSAYAGIRHNTAIALDVKITEGVNRLLSEL
jgi:hypothetical protein